MKKIVKLGAKYSLFFLVLLVLFTSGNVFAANNNKNNNQESEYARGELIVQYKGDTEPFRVVSLPQGKSVKEARDEYQAKDTVVYAEPNYTAHAFFAPNDPYYSLQWNFQNPVYGGITIGAAWNISNGSGVTIAVIDTGVAYENYTQNFFYNYYRAPDLAGTSFVPGYDFVNNDTHPNDDNSHGTHVAGTLAQSTNNALGATGVAFGASLMPVKVLDANGSGSYANVASGIIWAADHGAKVINLSLGGPVPSITLENAVAYAYSKGVTVVAAAGNDASAAPSYPAGYDAYVISVGATRYNETLAPYSNYGPSVDVVAPGGDLTVDQNADGYADGILQNTFNPNTKNTGVFGYWFFQGTSMSSPHVAGTAALLIAKGVVGPNAVRNILQNTAKDLGIPGRDDTYGWGRVNAEAALTAVTAAPDTTPPSQPTGLSATAVSSSQINLAWSPSTDTVAVTGYRMYRDGVLIATTTITSYADAGLAPATPYSYQVSAIDAALNESLRSTSQTATTLPLPTPDFSLSVSPASVAVPATGGTASYTITLVRTNFTAGVTLSVSGLPVGATGSFSPNPTSANSSVLTVTVSSATLAGSYPFTVTGTGGSPTVTRTATATLVKQPSPVPTVTMSANPTSMTLGQSSTLTWSSTDATSCTASNAWLGPRSTTGSEVVTPVGTGTFTYTLTCVGGGGSATASATVTVTALPTPDFSLSVSPASVSVVATGGTASYTVTITRSGGFSSAVTLSVSGLPAGAVGSFNPNPTTGNSSVLTITVSSATAAGSYPFTVTGTGGSPTVTHTGGATLVKLQTTGGKDPGRGNR